MKIIEETVKISPSHGGLGGIRILHMGDLHLRGRSNKIEGFIAELSRLAFDLLFITGDVIDNNNGIAWLCRYLKMLKPRLGAWFVLGNHDEYEVNLGHFFLHDRLKHRTQKNDLHTLFASLKDIGVRALVNETDQVRVGAAAIKVIGIRVPFAIDRYRPNHEKFVRELAKLRLFFRKQEKAGNQYTIVLTHLPDMVPLVGNMGADLYLSGHTHGGQVRLPFFGPVFTFSRFQRRYNRGLFKMGSAYLNVTAGMGQSRETPLRLFCPPEATLIELRR
ncbi:MAG: metallophosphoesterase [archaeon]